MTDTATPETASNEIVFRDVRFAYPGAEFVLDVDALEIPAGSRTAIVGPSGSGKTTLLNLVAGVVTPQRGTVDVGRTRVSRLGDGGRRNFRITHIGFVFQDFELVDYLDVTENVLLPYLVNPVLSLDRSVRERAGSLLSEVGLGDKRRRRIAALSQGERQRVAICRALLPEPRVLLADEPTGNLDPETSHGIVDLLHERSVRHSATLLCVTHDHTVLGAFDRVVDFATFQSEATT